VIYYTPRILPPSQYLPIFATANGVIDEREPGSSVIKAAIYRLQQASDAAAVAVGEVPKPGDRGRGGGGVPAATSATSTGTVVEENEEEDEDYNDDSDDGKNSVTSCLNIIGYGETIDRNSLQ
jgi:hypothetical protein